MLIELNQKFVALIKIADLFAKTIHSVHHLIKLIQRLAFAKLRTFFGRPILTGVGSKRIHVTRFKIPQDRLALVVADIKIQKVIAPLKRYIGYLAEVVEEAKENGTVDPGLDPDMVAWFIASGFIGIEAISYRSTGGADLRQRIDGWIDLFLRAVRTREAV